MRTSVTGSPVTGSPVTGPRAPLDECPQSARMTRMERWLLVLTTLMLAYHPWAVRLFAVALAAQPEWTSALVSLLGIFAALFVWKGF
jgi:hypothetical protein